MITAGLDVQNLTAGLDILNLQIRVRDLRRASCLSEVFWKDSDSVILVSRTVFEEALLSFPDHYDRETYSGIFLETFPFRELICLSDEISEICQACKGKPSTVSLKGYIHEFWCGHCLRVKRLEKILRS